MKVKDIFIANMAIYCNDEGSFFEKSFENVVVLIKIDDVIIKDNNKVYQCYYNDRDREHLFVCDNTSVLEPFPMEERRVLFNKTNLGEILDVVKEGDFFDKEYRDLYEEVLELRDSDSDLNHFQFCDVAALGITLYTCDEAPLLLIDGGPQRRRRN